MLTGRILAEQEFHDRQAAQRAAAGVRLFFEDDTYLDHETWIRHAMRQLQPLEGMCTLDFGCGHGMASVVLARRGARVTAFDLSGGYLEEAALRAQANEVTIAFAKADGERLPFADATFDRIWGNAVLHHLDIVTAAREVHRVLVPGGVAVFCEPLGDNWLLNLARRRPDHSTARHTDDEHPLTSRQLATLRDVFPNTEVRGFQFLSMTRRVLRHRQLVAGLDWCDDLLLRRVPQLQRYCRYAVLTLRKADTDG